MKPTQVAFSVFLAMLGLVHSASSQTFLWEEHTNAPFSIWASVASSADGSHLVAGQCCPGYLYVSADYGLTWTECTNYVPPLPPPTIAGLNGFQSLCSSSDGSHLAAGMQGGYIYLSSDYGSTWTQQLGPGSNMWCSIATSDSGQTIIAGQGGAFGEGYTSGYLYTTTNGGVAWTKQISLGYTFWQSTAASPDGGTLVANGGQWYLSTNFGSSWNQEASWPSANQILFLGDSNHMLALASGCCTYSSTNGGANWEFLAGAPVNGFTVSRDGSRLVGFQNSGGNNRYIYASTDGGATWTQEPHARFNFWDAIASSTNGRRILVGDSYLWTGGNPAAVTNFSGSLRSNGFQLSLTGGPQTPYSVESTTNLAFPVWQPLSTFPSDSLGYWSFIDTNMATTPLRFYRVVVP